MSELVNVELNPELQTAVVKETVRKVFKNRLFPNGLDFEELKNRLFPDGLVFDLELLKFAGYKLFEIISYLNTFQTEASALAYAITHYNYGLIGLLIMCFSLYKIISPLLPYLREELLRIQSTKRITYNYNTSQSDTTQLVLKLNDQIGTLNDSDSVITYLENIDTIDEKKVNNLLASNNLIPYFERFAKYFIVVPNLMIEYFEAKQGTTSILTPLGNLLYLPEVMDSLKEAVTIIDVMYTAIRSIKDVNMRDVRNFPYEHLMGSILFGGKRLQDKRKSKQFKKKTLRKNSNGPCIQTTEMMLSSYLNNNSKPIIKGYSIQKKFMPDKKLISIHTNIISNKSIRKTKKKNKRRTKKLKK